MFQIDLLTSIDERMRCGTAVAQDDLHKMKQMEISVHFLFRRFDRCDTYE